MILACLPWKAYKLKEVIPVNKTFLTVLLGFWFLAAGSTQAAPIYADIFVGSNGTSFGSGSVLGAPDGGGIFLGNPPSGQFLEVGFSTAIEDGVGNDIRIWDIEGFSPDLTETADVFGSTDGLLFSLLGSVTGGNAAGFLDIGGVFSGPIGFLRIVQTSTIDAIDIDAIEAFHVADRVAVPEPATILLLAAGLLGFGFKRRRACKK